jgi:putative ABC transport system permease protein
MDGYPTMNLMDREEFTQSIIGAISAMVNVIYGLLAISVVIALIGIANTLSLSIFERTRELGLLRAMGMTRNQMRSLVRWEAVIVALIGSVLGLVLGVGLAWILVNALSNEGFDTFNVPFMPMAVIVVGAAVLGVVAALLPARRASRLNVLDAIATE